MAVGVLGLLDLLASEKWRTDSLIGSAIFLGLASYFLLGRRKAVQAMMATLRYESEGEAMVARRSFVVGVLFIVFALVSLSYEISGSCMLGGSDR